jgi:hypothetical protein
MSRTHPSRRAALRAGAAVPLLTAAAAQEPTARPVLEGYTDQLSYAPGDTVRFYVSAGVGRYAVRLVRAGADPRVALDLPEQVGAVHPVPKDASARGCRWPVSFTYTLPADLRSGYYRVELTAVGGPRATGELFFVVRAGRPAADAKVLIQLSTNTYNAYTNWGGYSLYAYHGRHKVQGRRVSFDRPQSSQFRQWEEPFVRWAEAAGYRLDYCVNSDLEFRPDILAGYKLVLSVGHDEYWSAPMRDHLDRFIGTGGNVAFFSGNTCCWQVRSEENGRALACWKQNFGDDPAYRGGDHARLTSLWSHYLVNRPENSLTGVGFLWGGYHRSHGQLMDGPGSYTAHRPDHWLLAGTGLRRGEAFGAKLPAYKVVGYECDGCELTWANGLPTPTGRDGTPAGFEVVATAPARWHPDDCEWYERWEKGRTGNAVVGTYTRGGTVVTVGSTDWSFGLRGNDPAVTRITRNVLDRLGR